METTTVRDLMVPLEELPSAPADASLAEAMAVLQAAHAGPSGRLQYRVVLAVDAAGAVIGKLGHQAFLRGLLATAARSAPDTAAFDRAWVDPDLVSKMTEHLRFLQETFSECCERASWVRVRDAMVPVSESIADDAPIAAGIRALLDRGLLSVFVRRGDAIVGLLRQADVFDWIANAVTGSAATGGEERS